MQTKKQIRDRERWNRCYAKLKLDPERYAARKAQMSANQKARRLAGKVGNRLSASFSPAEIDVMAELMMRLRMGRDVSVMSRAAGFTALHKTVVRMKQKAEARIAEREAAE
jgi:hypothetical protein